MPTFQKSTRKESTPQKPNLRKANPPKANPPKANPPNIESLRLIATCVTPTQRQVCADLGIPVLNQYARSIGEVTPGCITDFSVHCFNTATLEILRTLGATRVTLHPELNLAQIRDMQKPIPTEAIIYGKLPLMLLGTPLDEHTYKNLPTVARNIVDTARYTTDTPHYITDRTGARFFIHTNKKGTTLYNAVPLFLADKLNEIEAAGITHGRLIFTDETADETRAVLRAYKLRKRLKIPFTRGKFFAKRDIP